MLGCQLRTRRCSRALLVAAQVVETKVVAQTRAEVGIRREEVGRAVEAFPWVVAVQGEDQAVEAAQEAVAFLGTREEEAIPAEADSPAGAFLRAAVEALPVPGAEDSPVSAIYCRDPEADLVLGAAESHAFVGRKEALRRVQEDQIQVRDSLCRTLHRARHRGSESSGGYARNGMS